MKPDNANNHWLFLSVYYAKNSWEGLVAEIATIIENLKKEKDIRNYIILFSHERGENVRIAVSFVDLHKNNELQTLIEERITNFILRNPSILDEEFEYGKTLWCNYPNNSLVWNSFDLSKKSTEEIEFISKSSEVILELLDGSVNSENFYSVSLFLLVKIFKNIKPAEDMDAIRGVENGYSTELSQFIEQYAATDDLIDQFGGNWADISELIYSYWNDNDNTADLKEWEDSIRKMIQKGKSVLTLTHSIFYVLDLTMAERDFLLGLLSKYFRENRYC